MAENTLNFITYILVGTIVAAFFGCVLYLLAQEEKGKLAEKRRWINQLPSLISTLGVLGTFIGITIGLLKFDSSNLNTSIPLLLSGLKTAFLTSLAGMIGSLILSKLVSSSYDSLDKGLSDINIATGQICQSVQQMGQDIRSSINVLLSRISEDSETQSIFYNLAENLITDVRDQLKGVAGIQKTLSNTKDLILEVDANLSDMKRVAGEDSQKLTEIASSGSNLIKTVKERTDNITDEIGKTSQLLSEKFNEFSELLRKSNTEALVEVMKNVTEEFQTQMNSLISRLVQENFSKLNESVEKLNVWQQENKEMIDSLTSQYKAMEHEFSTTSRTLKAVSSDTKSLVSDGGKLNELVNVLNEVIVKDEKFKDISANLTEAVSLTKENMLQFEESTSKLNEWVRKQRDFVDGVVVLIKKLDELNNIRDYAGAFWDDTRKQMNAGIGIISEGSRTLQKQLNRLDEQFYSRLSTTLEELDLCIQSMVKTRSR